MYVRAAGGSGVCEYFGVNRCTCTSTYKCVSIITMYHTSVEGAYLLLLLTIINIMYRYIIYILCTYMYVHVQYIREYSVCMICIRSLGPQH